MPTFSFTAQVNDDPPEGLEDEFRTELDAIRKARRLLSDTVLDRARAVDSASVGVGDGGLSSGDVRWLGRWAWTLRTGWAWKPPA